jgi:dihydroflavonol-4-reductase
MSVAAITGATGLVGANLAVLLRQAGHTVRCTRRAGSRTDLLDGVGVEWAEADLAQPDALARAFDGADVVFHCAAAVSVRKKATPEMIATNVDGTRHVVEAVRRAGVRRLVHCSSVVAVGLTENGQPATEEAVWNFDKYGLGDGYAITKRDSERLVMEETRRGLDAVVVNPTYMFGPYDQRPSSGGMIIEVVRGKVPGYSTGSNNFVDVRDVARGMIAAWQRGRSGERYILGGENMPYRDIFRRIAAVAGVKPPRFAIPRWLAAPIGWVGDLQETFGDKDPLISSNTLAWGYATRFQFDSSKAKRELGYTVGNVDDGIRDALAWFRARGMLPA